MTVVTRPQRVFDRWEEKKWHFCIGEKERRGKGRVVTGLISFHKDWIETLFQRSKNMIDRRF